MSIDAVVSHHLNPFRSGVARFNEVLAEALGVPVLGLFDERLGDVRAPLLSFKVKEMGAEERRHLEQLLDERGWEIELFLHAFDDLELEHRLLRGARRVLCGNHHIAACLQGLDAPVETVWTPGLLRDERRIEPAEITVFSFGMAHKLRVDKFRRLRELLDRSGRSYAVMVSTANHETASIRDAELVYRQMHEVFPRSLYFLGNLSDLAVQHYLDQATYFAAFFEHGLRANNTSVASALERGAVVLTNLDEHSPPELRHMEALIDVDACDALPDDPLTLRRIGVRAMELGRERSWQRLVERIGAPAPRTAPLG